MGRYGDYSGKIINDDKGVSRLDSPGYWETGMGRESCRLEEGTLRKNLGSILEKEKSYSVFQVFINPVASDELSKYVGISEWNEKSKSNDVNYREPKFDEERRLNFKRSLKDDYFSVLNERMDFDLKASSFIDFPNVEDVGNNGYDSKSSLLSPITYIIKNEGDNVSRFQECVKSMNDDSSYEKLKKMEDPQNYNLSKIEILRDKKINPFIVGEESFEIDSVMLKNTVNFLIPFRIKYISRSDY